MNNINQLKIGVLISSDSFPEMVNIVSVIPKGNLLTIYGKGDSGELYERTLDIEALSKIHIVEKDNFQGDSKKFKLSVEAIRLGLAYEYDPYFALSIAKINPLPHQLEAVYEYFLKAPRIRFLLADDPGAGKTIMAINQGTKG